MSIWTDEKVDFLKKNWGLFTARELAEKMGPGFTRNSIIGKASRLGLSAKIKTRNVASNQNNESSNENKNLKQRRNKKSRFSSILIEKDFEPENPKQLEELDENSCKWPIGHPDEKNFYFCGRSSLKDFSYCKLHLLYAYQPKGKKEDPIDKEKEEVPEFIGKKIRSA